MNINTYHALRKVADSPWYKNIDWGKWGPRLGWGLGAWAVSSLLGAKPWLSLLLGGAGAAVGPSAWKSMTKMFQQPTTTTTTTSPTTTTINPQQQPAASQSPAPAAAKPQATDPGVTAMNDRRQKLGQQMESYLRTNGNNFANDRKFTHGIVGNNLQDFNWVLNNYKLSNGNTLKMQYPGLEDMSKDKSIWTPGYSSRDNTARRYGAFNPDGHISLTPTTTL